MPNYWQCQLKLQGWEEARSDCVDALALDPSSIKGMYRLTEALVSLGRLSEADGHLLRLESLPDLAGLTLTHLRAAVDAGVAAGAPVAEVAPVAADVDLKIGCDECGQGLDSKKQKKKKTSNKKKETNADDDDWETDDE